MTDAINSKNDVLSAQELDAVSGGVLWIPSAVVQSVHAYSEQVRQMTRQGEPTQEGQNDPAQMFQQILQQLSGQG